MSESYEWGFETVDKPGFVWGPMSEQEARDFVEGHAPGVSTLMRRPISSWERHE